MGSAFTTYGEKLQNRLHNFVDIGYAGNSVRVLALWDTGATNSCISDEVAKQLCLIPTGKEEIRTPSGCSIRNAYLVDVCLPNNVVIDNLKVIDSAIGAQGIGMLIGMDIIQRGDFSVSNYKGKTIFTFRIPSEGITDYAKNMRVRDLIGPTHGRGKRKKIK